jgi:hypothetical protein
MKVYRPDGTFITRAERQAIKEAKEEKITFIVCAIIIAAILVYCAINNIEIYL